MSASSYPGGARDINVPVAAHASEYSESLDPNKDPYMSKAFGQRPVGGSDEDAGGGRGELGRLRSLLSGPFHSPPLSFTGESVQAATQQQTSRSYPGAGATKNDPKDSSDSPTVEPGAAGDTAAHKLLGKVEETQAKRQQQQPQQGTDTSGYIASSRSAEGDDHDSSLTGNPTGDAGQGVGTTHSGTGQSSSSQRSPGMCEGQRIELETEYD